MRAGAALAMCLVSACSYDFEKFARSTGAIPVSDAAADAAIDAEDATIDAADDEHEAAAADGAGEAATDARDAADLVDAAEAAPPDAESDAPPVIPCSAYQGVVYAGHCYYVMAKATDEYTAELACPLPDSHLVTITSADEQAAVTPLVSGAGDHWMGLSEQRSTYTQKNEANFRWTTGEPYKPATSYRNWAASEPSFLPAYGDCVVMRQSGQWASSVCTAQLPFVCERDY